MEPLLINETFISRFKFWLDGQVQDGMHHREELFRCFRTETQQGRQRIYDLGWALSHEGVHTVITASQHHYTLWVSLRSLETLEQASKFLDPNSTLSLACSASA
jgi:hypothetical protein